MDRASEVSCGVVPIRFGEAGLEVLLGKQARGSRHMLPKGHVEGAETHQEAAIRELLEESGHRPTLFLTPERTWSPNPSEALELEPIVYRRFSGRMKAIHFFVAQVEYHCPIICYNEVQSVHWLPINNETKSLLHDLYASFWDRQLMPLFASLKN